MNTAVLDRNAVHPVIVAPSWSTLDGPTAGTVELPIHVDWTPTNQYDLAVPRRVQTMYRTVLQEARAVNDLHYLNADVLQSIWSRLRLPARVRGAWEEAFPELTVAY